MLKKTICSIAFILILTPNLLWADENSNLKSQHQKYSYAMGYGIGKGMQQNDMNVDIKAFSIAVEDALANKPPQVSEKDMVAAAEANQKEQMEKLKSMAAIAEKKGKEFLEANKKKQGVVTLPSGLQYLVLNKGEGKKPTANDTVSVHYRGALLDGTVFDSSYDRGMPATFPVQGVIKGWQEGVQLMSVGAKWKLFIPASLAYGDQGAGVAIGPGETLIFDVELLEIK